MTWRNLWPGKTYWKLTKLIPQCTRIPFPSWKDCFWNRSLGGANFCWWWKDFQSIWKVLWIELCKLFAHLIFLIPNSLKGESVLSCSQDSFWWGQVLKFCCRFWFCQRYWIRVCWWQVFLIFSFWVQVMSFIFLGIRVPCGCFWQSIQEDQRYTRTIRAQLEGLLPNRLFP